ncbi:MAG TPA: YbaB/EbfC family nucleoid-associated protein [Candidatus Eisenbacteria bacterium]|jgi:DNA-binding YbaB/EbfC family protein|nr:YbaB/EbfC family nucleoid-associated protein [Candidatus Eisenbacteria bacterium]
MKNIAAMMKQAQKMQAQMAQVQEELGEKRVEASAGGGMVTAVVNGRGELVQVKIDPEIVKAGDIPMLEDLVLAAVNEARSRSEELMRDAMNRVAGPFGGFPFV